MKEVDEEPSKSLPGIRRSFKSVVLSAGPPLFNYPQQEGSTIADKKKKNKKKEEKKKKEEDLFRIIASEVLLKRLPENRDIASCRCVCKQWRSFLSIPEFIRREYLAGHENSRKIENPRLRKGLDELTSSSLNQRLGNDLKDGRDIVYKKKKKKKKNKNKNKKKKNKEENVFRIIAYEVFLKRLPEKRDIASCRLVCKKWRLFLSTPEFIRTHQHEHPEGRTIVDKKTQNQQKDDLLGILASGIFLKRLPEKRDIASCRHVCKKWRSFLSAPEFIRTHQQEHPVTIDDYKLLVLDGSQPKGHPPFRTFSLDQTIPAFPIPKPNPNLEKVFIIASLDGLVCVALQLEDEENVRLLFFNPCTGAHKQLSPFPRYDLPKHSFDRYRLSASHPISFYKDSSGDYKLLCLSYNFRHDDYVAFVYSRRSDSWKEIDFSVIPPNERRLCAWAPATFCGQFLYFNVPCYPDCSFCPFSCFSRIICFDVNTEKFREIPVPHRFPKSYSNVAATNSCSIASLLVLDGCLYMYLLCRASDEESGVDLYKLQGDDEWVKVDDYAFTVEPQLQEPHSICIESTGNWLAVLDEYDNSFKKMNVQDFQTHFHLFYRLTGDYESSHVIYVQTLVDP